MTRTSTRAAAARLLRLGGLTLASALALAGCEAQPVGTFDPARYVADPAGQAFHSVVFQPGSPELGRGESERLAQFLRGQVLGPNTDVLLRVGASGSAVLDAQRLSALRAAVGGTRARVQVATVAGAGEPAVRPDLGLVRVAHGNRIVVECPGNPADPDWELTTPLPEIGCANAFNLATQAANPRDLFVPRPFGGTDSTVTATAVRRLQEGKVKTNTVAINTDVSSGN